MLVQLALIVFGMFGLLAAIVDMGLVRLTQVQMQGAADSAAIEGLRARDSQPDPVGGIDGFSSDCVRRLAARDYVQWTFDDNFDLTNDDPTFVLGAGPNVKFTGGAGDLSAYQFMSVPAANDPDPAFRGGRTFKPFLQLNQSTNETYGDMVSGTFVPDAPVLVDAQGHSMPGVYEYGADSLPGHPEYDRTDFSKGAPIPDPAMMGNCAAASPSVSPAIPDSAFLVRLRRTSFVNAQDLDSVDGISSRGTGLPLLFGRGTLIQPNDSGYDPRRDGITVRATAIADARPALRIGGDPIATPRTTFTLSAFDMLDMPQAGSVDFGSGDIRFSGNPDPVGRFITPTTLITVGDPAAGLMATSVACGMPGSAVQPLTAVTAPFDIDRVAGFARVTIQWQDCTTGAATLSRLPAPSITPGNATTALDSGLPMMPLAVVPQVLAASATFATKPSAVLAPALVR